MNEALKASFRTFADSWSAEDHVDDSGLTGADLKIIADQLEGVVLIERITLDGK
ncbi:hypothetical protein [Sphingobium sp. CECT 9361]|uniref:hypothetical protein n=1 Tax=Sphingobium sp. CECT 9361 TaxID=2845384 RepID=UPI001E37A028|nr:hypothetical protein [Sphingobium sp. CECT 9361]CAH0355298.1 hypothetical protein SPH9361_03375 [Sphingobium sp. CECT 9361]